MTNWKKNTVWLHALRLGFSNGAKLVQLLGGHVVMSVRLPNWWAVWCLMLSSPSPRAIVAENGQLQKCQWKWHGRSHPPKALMCLSIKFMGSLYSPSSPDFRKALAALYHCLLFLDTVSLQLPRAGFYFPLLALDPLSLRWPCTTATLWAVASFLLRVLPTTLWNNNMKTLNAQCPPKLQDSSMQHVSPKHSLHELRVMLHCLSPSPVDST